LFPDEMGAESSEIAELRRLSRAPEEPTVQGHVVSRVTHELPRRRSQVVGWAAGVGIALGAAALYANRQPARPREAPVAASASPAPLSAFVTLGVQVSPGGVPGLSVTIAGAPAPAGDLTVPRSSEPVQVRVQAPGYRLVELSVVPDRDQALVVTLTPNPVVLPAPSEKAATSARPPAAAPTGVIRRYPF
jgi:hypothetical protein